MGRGKGTDWSEAETATVLEMRAAGYSFPEIASKLPGRSASGVNARYLWLTMTEEQHRARRARINEWRKREHLNCVHTPRQQRERVEPRYEPSAELLAERDERYRLSPRSLTAFLCGDPPPGYSALDRRRSAQ